MSAEHFPFQCLRLDSLQERGVGEDLGYNRTPGFSVCGELDLEQNEATRRLHRDQVGVAASKRDLATEDDQAWRAREREQLGRLLDEAVKAFSSGNPTGASSCHFSPSDAQIEVTQKI